MSFEETVEKFKMLLREYFDKRQGDIRGSKADTKAIRKIADEVGADVYRIRHTTNSFGDNITEIGVIGAINDLPDVTEEATIVYNYFTDEVA